MAFNDEGQGHSGRDGGNESADSNSSNSQRKADHITQQDGGSGSSVKKMSKKDKLKSLFGKTKK